MNGSIWYLNDQVLVWGINVVLQVSVIVPLALLVARALRHSSAARYGLLCAALLLVFLCPVFAAIVQSSGMSFVSVVMMDDVAMKTQPEDVTPQITNNVFPPGTSPEVQFSQMLQSRNSHTSFDKDPNSRHPGEFSAAPGTVTEGGRKFAQAPEGRHANGDKISGSPSERTASRWGWALRTLGPPLLIVWSVGAIWLLIRLVVSWLNLAKLLRAAEPNTDECLATTFREACLALGRNDFCRMPELVFSDRIFGPVAAGIRDPKVVLPQSFSRHVDAVQLRDLLIHEVAHVARGDQLVVLLQNLMGALFWIHPLVRRLNSGLSQAREEVCDNYVLAATDGPSYSRTLLTLTHLLDEPKVMPGTVGLFTSRWKLEQRVAGLLDEQRNRVTRLSRTALALISVVSLTLAVIVASGTIGIAAASPQDISAKGSDDMATGKSDIRRQPYTSEALPKEQTFASKATATASVAHAQLSKADQEATALARAAHRQAAAINGLPRFYYRVNEWHGMVERMRARPQATIRILAIALKGTVLAPTETDSSDAEESNGLAAGYGHGGPGPFMSHRVEGSYTFAWDENHFLFESEHPRQPAMGAGNKTIQFWSRDESWWRAESGGTLGNIARGPSAFAYWQNIHLFQFSCYLRQTPRTFWWGGAVHPNQTISNVPPEEATWAKLPDETFGEELCDVMESSQRRERLWISQATRRVRGILSYHYKQLPDAPQFFESRAVTRIAGRSFKSISDYGLWINRDATPEQNATLRDAWNRFIVDGFPENATPNELMRLADYREVKPDVWIPFEEERVVAYPAGADKSDYVKTRIVVEAVEFDRSLEDTIAKLKPKDGDPIQDSRFCGVHVSYRHGMLTDDEVKAKAEAAKSRGEFRAGGF